jgi:hypothetical protein
MRVRPPSLELADVQLLCALGHMLGNEGVHNMIDLILLAGDGRVIKPYATAHQTWRKAEQTILELCFF